MKCSYCGGDSTSFEKCSCCGSPISDEDIEAFVDTLLQCSEVSAEKEDEMLDALVTLYDRKNFKKVDLLGKALEAIALDHYDSWKANPEGKSKEDALRAIGHAFAVFESGAENGNIFCMLKTADYYHRGLAGEIDNAKYIYWLKKAAAEGNDEAKELLRDAESSSNEVVTPEVSSGAIWTIVGFIIMAIFVGLKVLIAFSH